MNLASAERISDGIGPMARWREVVELPETLQEIVQRVAEGERLKQVCRSKGWPYSVVAQWMANNEAATKAYEQALRLAADDLALETIEIADEQAAVEKENGDVYDPDVGRDKLRVDTRLKVASRLYRDRYGEQVQHNVMVDSFGDMLKRVSERKLAAIKASQQPGDSAKVIEGEVISAGA